MGRRQTEREFIEQIRSRISLSGGQVIKAIGDDCAVIRGAAGNVLLLTIDTLVEGVHFDRGWHPPHLLGRKAASVNLSDIAAMGGTPKTALLSVAAPVTLEGGWLDAFLDGFLEALGQYEVMLIGGDTVKSNSGIVFSITLIGEAVESRVLYRSGAAPGDLLWISGIPGRAAAGLALCRAGLGEEERWQELVQAHLDPTPEVQLGEMLARSGLVSAMMDTSDGIATDCAHLCKESSVGAEITVSFLPRTALLDNAAASLHEERLDWALTGGEDFLLLFTCKPQDRVELERQVKENFGREIYCIGRIIEGAGVFLCEGTERREITYQGYDHFAG